MRITYDSEVDTLYIQLRPLGLGEAENRELGDGVVGDYGPDGRLAGIEILDASQILGQDLERVIVELSPTRKALAA